MRSQHDARHVVEVCVVDLLLERASLLDAFGGKEGVEAVVQDLQRIVGKRSVHADHHFLPHPAVGVEIAVEGVDVVHGVLHIVGDMDEVEVGFGHESVVQKVVRDKAAPGLPIVPVLAIDHHHGNDRHLASLHEGEDLESLVVRAETARKQREGVGFFREVEFAGEKIIEVNELRIAVDRLVRRLLKGEADIEAEAFLRAGTLLRRAHDAISTAGDEHVAVLHDFFTEGHGLFIFVLLWLGAGAAEDRHFFHAVVAGENPRRVAHFPQGAAHEFHLGDRRAVAPESERGVDHVFDVAGGFALGDFAGEGLDSGIDFL